ncbi:MAG: hypothetical protein ACRERD_35515, partial [Candidatus Binatia bacterium]
IGSVHEIASVALEAYESALRGNPNFADCHHNLAPLCKGLRKPHDAIRQLAQCRRLIEMRS